MIDLSAYLAAFSFLPEGIREAEVNAERDERTSLRVEGGFLTDGQAEAVTRLYVRAAGERTGTAYTERLDEAPREAILRAAENARCAPGAVREPMNGANRISLPAPCPPDSIDEALTFCRKAERSALSLPNVLRVLDCSAALCSREARTVNSHGLDAAYTVNWTELTLSVLMKRQGAPAPGAAFFSRRNLSELDSAALARAAVQDGEEYDGGGLPSVTLKSGRYDAVLSGRVMRNILMTAWMELSGRAMRSGGSVFSPDAGTRIGSPALNVLSAPSHPRWGRAWPLDSEGTVVSSVRLVEEGTLRTPLHTLSTGRSTGSAGRVDRMTGSPPIHLTTVPALLYVEPGEETQAQLIGRMGTGLLLTYSLDLFHSVNIASGAFSIPCGGVWYENGRPVGSVSQATVAGNVKDLLQNIEAVGFDLDFDDFYLRSYTIGSPSALVRGLGFAF
jgi:PmbA protein